MTLERLERALAAIAYVIVQEGADGAVYAPYLERLEKEIAALRARDDVVSRARRHLDRLRDQAEGVRAICAR